MDVEEGDAVIAVQVSDGSHEIFVGTKDGMSIRFRESDVRSMGRTAGGVRGVELREGDAVVAMEVTRPVGTSSCWRNEFDELLELYDGRAARNCRGRRRYHLGRRGAAGDRGSGPGDGCRPALWSLPRRADLAAAYLDRHLGALGRIAARVWRLKSGGRRSGDGADIVGEFGRRPEQGCRWTCC